MDNHIFKIRHCYFGNFTKSIKIYFIYVYLPVISHVAKNLRVIQQINDWDDVTTLGNAIP